MKARRDLLTMLKSAEEDQRAKDLLTIVRITLEYGEGYYDRKDLLARIAAFLKEGGA